MASRKLEVEIVGDARSLQRAFGSAASSTGSFGDRLEKLGSSMRRTGAMLSVGLTAPLALFGKKSFEAATEFESSMSKIIGLVGVSEKQVDAWSKDILRLGPELGKSPRELADAMFFITSAGLRGERALDALTAAGKASAAGLGETKVVADALTSAMNAYAKKGLTAGRATDILTAAVREGKLEAETLAPVLGSMLPTASALGISFETVAGTLAVLSKTGTDAAEGSTQIQAAMSAMLTTSPKVVKGLAKVGLTQEQLRKTAAGPGGLVAVFRLLEDRFKGNLEAMKEVIPNVRAFRPVMNALAQSGKDVDKTLKGVSDSAGSLETAFSEALGTTENKMARFHASVEATQIAVGNLLQPAVEMVAKKLSELADWFNNLSERNQKLVVTIGVLAAALGPVLIILGSLVTAIVALASPIGVAIIAVAAIAAGLVIFEQRTGKVSAAIRSLADMAKQYWPRVREAAEAVMRWYRENLQPTIEAVVNFITKLWRKLGDDLIRIIVPVLRQIGAAVTAAGKIIKATVEFVSAILRGDWSAAWSAAKDVVNTLVQFVKSTLQNLFAYLKGVVRLIGQVAKEIGSAFVDGIIGGMGGLASAVYNYVKGAIGSAISRLVPFYSNSPQEIIGYLLAEGILRGYEQQADKLKDKVKEKVSQAIDEASRVISSKRSVFESAFSELTSVALQAFDKIHDTMTKSERELARMEENRAKKQRQRAKREAQDALTEALAAQGTLNPADFESMDEYLAAVAEAGARVKAAQQQLADAEYEIRRANLQRKAELERKKQDEQTALERKHFEDRLQALQNSFARGKLTVKQFHERMVALLKEYHIPYKKGANQLGLALAAGLMDALNDVEKAAKALAQKILDQFSQVKVVVAVAIQQSDKPGERQHGGPVRAGQPYIVGEAGPEMFVPSRSGTIIPNNASVSGRAIGGAPSVTLNVYGSVTSERDLVETIRNALIQEGRRKGGNLLAGYA